MSMVSPSTTFRTDAAVSTGCARAVGDETNKGIATAAAIAAPAMR
jgi:hypothetical protein